MTPVGKDTQRKSRIEKLQALIESIAYTAPTVCIHLQRNTVCLNHRACRGATAYGNVRVPTRSICIAAKRIIVLPHTDICDSFFYHFIKAYKDFICYTITQCETDADFHRRCRNKVWCIRSTLEGFTKASNVLDMGETRL